MNCCSQKGVVVYHRPMAIIYQASVSCACNLNCSLVDVVVHQYNTEFDSFVHMVPHYCLNSTYFYPSLNLCSSV